MTNRADHETFGLHLGQLCIMHLETLDEPLTPAERAYLLGNDPKAITESADLSRGQEVIWTESAMDDLADDPETAAVNLGEARAWARDTAQARDALAFVNQSRHTRPIVTFERELAEIQRHERAWLKVHNACDANWKATKDCPEHGAEIRAGQERQRAATRALREALRAAMSDSR